MCAQKKYTDTLPWCPRSPKCVEIFNLKREDNSNPVIVVIGVIDKHCPHVLNSAKGVFSNCNARSAVNCLYNFLAIIPEFPLCCFLLIGICSQIKGINGSEVSFRDVFITGTDISVVRGAILVIVVLTGGTHLAISVGRTSDRSRLQCGHCLPRVGHLGTAVLGVILAVIVRILVTNISDPILIIVQLVRVGYFVAVVMGIRNSVLVIVHTIVTSIPDQVVVDVLLPGIGILHTAVTRVPDTISVSVLLIWILDVRAVVLTVLTTVTILVIITHVSELIAIDIFLSLILMIGTVVAQISHTIAVHIRLVRVGNQIAVITSRKVAVGFLLFVAGPSPLIRA